jgi:hypothetical protein
MWTTAPRGTPPGSKAIIAGKSISGEGVGLAGNAKLKRHHHIPQPFCLLLTQHRLFSFSEYPVARYGDEGVENPL